MKWKSEKLGDICTISSGGTPSRNNSTYFEGTIPWAKISDIENANGYISNTEEYITKEALKSINNRIFPPNTLLLAIYGSVGKVAITMVEMSTNQAILGIRPLASSKIDLQYLKHYFSTIKERLLDRAVGGTLQNISLGIVKQLDIPLPPLPIQQKIAAILDEADALRRKDKALLAKYDELLQAVFYDMFGDPVKNEKGWEVRKLSNIAESRLGKMLDGKKIIGNNLKPYLRNSNVQWFTLRLDDLLEMDFDEKDKIEFKLEYGDILMCEGGEIGRCTIWRNDLEECYFQKAIHRIRLNEKSALPEYFVYMFYQYAKSGGLNQFMGAATISHLTGEKLKKMILPFPPIKLQKQFEATAKNINLQKSQIIQQQTHSENLFQSLMQRAFKGELVN